LARTLVCQASVVGGTPNDGVRDFGIMFLQEWEGFVVSNANIGGEIKA